MSNRKIDRVSRRKGRISWLLTGVGVVAAMLVASIVLGSATVQAGPPPPTETPMPTEEPPDPTPTTEPGAPIFTGDFDVTEADVCGGGTFTMTLTPDGTAIVALSVVGFFVLGSANDNQTDFDPPVPIAGDGTFDTSGPLPPPLETILSTLAGTFDFGVDPATVSGTLKIGLVADPTGDPLCEATFSGEALAAGAPTPTLPPPAAAATATVAPGLPSTGSTGGSSSGGALWAVVAGIVGLFALGTAGVASLRRRTA